jgi:hypothetical protein
MMRFSAGLENPGLKSLRENYALPLSPVEPVLSLSCKIDPSKGLVRFFRNSLSRRGRKDAPI